MPKQPYSCIPSPSWNSGGDDEHPNAPTAHHRRGPPFLLRHSPGQSRRQPQWRPALAICPCKRTATERFHQPYRSHPRVPRSRIQAKSRFGWSSLPSARQMWRVTIRCQPMQLLSAFSFPNIPANAQKGCDALQDRALATSVPRQEA